MRYRDTKTPSFIASTADIKAIYFAISGFEAYGLNIKIAKKHTKDDKIKDNVASFLLLLKYLLFGFVFSDILSKKDVCVKFGTNAYTIKQLSIRTILRKILQFAILQKSSFFV